MNLVMFETKIRQDKEGRYCLNDLHKAAVLSGANERTKEPGKFMASPQTIELVKELTDTQILGIDPVNTVKGGKNQGTYACKELVYSYAMWISAKFQLLVIQTFDKWLHEEYQRKAIRENAREGYKDLTKALKYSLESLGKTAKYYHYSNEADMINLIALGMTAKQFRVEHGLKDKDQLRDCQTPFQIFAVEQLQRMDEQLINLGFTVEQRRNALQKRFDELSIRAIGLSG